MTTLAVAAPLPPPPLQLNVKLVAVVRFMMVSVPLGARAPLQPPEALQLSALLDDQVSVVLPPLVTVSGAALSMTRGAGGVTVTLAVAAPLPPGPVHVRVNADADVSAAVTSLPMVGRAPLQLPDAVQLVASVVDHLNVVVVPLITEVGSAVMVTVGAGATATLAVAAAMPPAPVQVRV
jgi:hypothetical protein